MSVSYPLTATARSDAAVSSVEIPQLRIRGIFAVWAAAALPMAARLARCARARRPLRRRWPRADGEGADRVPRDRHGLAVRPRRDPRRPRAGDARWSTVREALAPLSAEPAQRPRRRSRMAGRDPAYPRVHRAQELVALVAAPGTDFATLLESDAGKAFLDGAFGWYGLILAMFLFNTVLGEELLFRGYSCRA